MYRARFGAFMWLRLALSTGLLAATSALPSLACLDLASFGEASCLASVAITDAEVLRRQALETDLIMASLDMDGVVTSRQKSEHSLHLKMQRKGLARHEVLDRLAVRVRVDSEADCYALLNTLHGAYITKSDAFDDYIAHPKPNGYQSLHTVLLLPEGPVEVQIRTHAMHELAENGQAAHAEYKRAQALQIAA